MGAHKMTKQTTVKACSPSGKKQAAQQQKTFTKKKKTQSNTTERNWLNPHHCWQTEWGPEWSTLTRIERGLLLNSCRVHGKQMENMNFHSHQVGTTSQFSAVGWCQKGTCEELMLSPSTRNNKVTTPVLSLVNFLGNKKVSVEAQWGP